MSGPRRLVVPFDPLSRFPFRLFAAIGVVATLFAGMSAEGAPDKELAAKARAAMVRAADYFHDKLSVQGTYVWAYSPDLSIRRGEGGKVDASIGWVQPPGTPAIGASFLRIYEATGDSKWLEAARESAAALVSTQLLSGGWYYHVDTDPQQRSQWCYRAGGPSPVECQDIEGNKKKNLTMFDDATTQSVLNFLIWLDEVQDGKNEAVRGSIDYSLEKLLASQYPNGAWPNVLGRRPKKEVLDKIVPGKAASIPADPWPREWVKPSGSVYFITNDNAMRDIVHVLLNAERRFGRKDVLEAAVRMGDFLLAAQLPAPQRGWAQTYDVSVQPIWGRKLEPPSVASSETAGTIDALLLLYRRTGEKRFLDGAREAANWLKQVRLHDGTWARFYELSTNRPLYINKNYEVSYSDEDLHKGYSYKGEFGISDLLNRVDRIVAGQPDPVPPYWESKTDQLSDAALEQRVGALLRLQDDQGRWLDDGWIKSQNFVDASFALARYVDGRRSGETARK
jgi:hypothetical protein